MEKVTVTTVRNRVKDAGLYTKSDEYLIEIFTDLLNEYNSYKENLESIQKKELDEIGEIQTFQLDGMEKTRKEILQYSDRLGLSPKSRKSISDVPLQITAETPANMDRNGVPSVPSADD